MAGTFRASELYQKIIGDPAASVKFLAGEKGDSVNSAGPIWGRRAPAHPRPFSAVACAIAG
jgi:hypothetical protein